MEHQNNKDFVSGLKPKSAFRLGMLSSLVVVFVIGFFVLLGMFIKKDDNVLAGVKNNAPAKNIAQEAIQGDSGIFVQPITDEDWIRGDKNAPISIIEFSDTECPFCKRFHETMQQVVDQYDGQVNWIYRHFPLTSLHSKAAREAEATECAGEQGGNDGFWAYLDRLMEITPSNNGLEDSQLPQIAQDIGLDRAKFQECLDSGKYASKVKDHTNQAQAAGGRGTPHSIIVVDGQTIPIQGAQPFAQIQQVLDGLLN